MSCLAPIQKHVVKSNQASRQCSFAFLIWAGGSVKVCSTRPDRYSSFKKITQQCSSKKSRFVVDWGLVFPPWQRTCIHSIYVCQFLTKNGMVRLYNAPYSSDLAPCDFFLLPRMKRGMKGLRFDDVKQKTRKELSAITDDEYRKYFEQWNLRLDKYISCNGKYFEGDKIVL